MANYLIIRLSAIGDVAMTIPVIYSAAKANPQRSFTVLTQEFLTSLFINPPENMEVMGIDIKGEQKKLRGLVPFANRLSREDFDAVLDLHDVLRSKVIRSLMRMRGKKVYVLDKARKERKELTRRENKRLRPLKPVVERYTEVFYRAGIRFDLSFISLFADKAADLSVWKSLVGEKKGYWVGIAPFAKHRGKIYPVGEMEKVVESLSQREDTTVFLFGGRGEEAAVLEQWTSRYPNVMSTVGCTSLDGELALMSHLDLLVCMDSANMHFASLVGTRVISVWGATHPYAGFYVYGQNKSDAVQLPLACRPCSVFGQKPCFRGDWACMTGITPESLMEKIESALSSAV
ncbi:MAG: glycosyltransferase family 9 protein [Bacteroides sp.]|nr:glycosyltransferase family 9 protein [Bacteroides sp.]